MKTIYEKTQKALLQYIILAVIVAAPAFYLITHYFYAEDMRDLVESIEQKKPIPVEDLDIDIAIGMILQFVLIVFIIIVSLYFVQRITKKNFAPFYDTLNKIEKFSIDDTEIPKLMEADTAEFSRFNSALTKLMLNAQTQYKGQKESIENVSHELQTPIAIIQGKLDLLLQQPLNEQQAILVQSLYETSNRISRLNKNMLLLARIENTQYHNFEKVNVVDVLEKMMPNLDAVIGELKVEKNFPDKTFSVNANKDLLDDLIANLVVNAVRYNKPDGKIFINVSNGCLEVANTSQIDYALDAQNIFKRFYRTSEKVPGSGLGLAIVKSICDYHNWKIQYQYRNQMHYFIVDFNAVK